MTLKDLENAIATTRKYYGDCASDDVELTFWVNDIELKPKSMSRFHIIPEMTIGFERVKHGSS